MRSCLDLNMFSETMNKTIFLLICCLAITVAEQSVDETADYVKQCSEELHISDAKKYTDNTVPCEMIVCMFKKQGHLKADGTYDIENVVNMQPNFEDKQKFRKTLVTQVELCSKTAKGDACLLAKCMTGL